MAVKILNEIQSYFNFILKECKDIDVYAEAMIDWDKFSENHLVAQ